MILRIQNEDILFAIIVKKDYNKEGNTFFTDSEFPLQMAFISKSKNYITDRHLHPEFERIITQRAEFIYVRTGLIYIKFYDNNKKFLKGYCIEEGDSVLILEGGHSIEFLKDSKIIELRLGPYNGDLDKTKF